MADASTILNDILEIVGFIKDNGATKEDLKFFATKEDLKVFATKEDFKVLENKMDAGFASLRSEIREVKEELSARIKRLETGTKEDVDAIADDYTELKERVEILEKQVKQLQAV